MSAKKGQALIGLIQKISGLNDTEVQEIFSSKELQKHNLNPDHLTTDDIRFLAAQMLEKLNSEIEQKAPLSSEQLFSHDATFPQA